MRQLLPELLFCGGVPDDWLRTVAESIITKCTGWWLTTCHQSVLTNYGGKYSGLILANHMLTNTPVSDNLLVRIRE